ncbi:MAG: BMP family ABC transporter substrate-binding protein [Ideonella sp.]|nr:BMP family ABC transporter substrate-binding protein [Ideonella sp.]MCC7456336.1 BMP family ABC transporter substrate-binding protein [Nitrospira sp.]
MYKNLIARAIARAHHLGLFAAMVLALAFALPVPLRAQPASAPAHPDPPAVPPLKVAFVYVTPIGQAGWTYQHDLGRREMERALGAAVKTTVVEDVAEGPDAERVLRDLARQGQQLIFATSFGYLEGALRVAAEFPGVRIEHAGGYKSAPNLATYNVRAYEARWLAGRLAAMNSNSGIAGYVAGFPVPEVVQGIDAFALGMRSVNPQASVRVVWLNTWFDPARERDAALALIGQGADVLTNHTASPAVAVVAEQQHVRLIANQSDMRAFAPDAQLAAVTPQWGAYYTQVARDVIAGRWTNAPVWGGLRSGMVTLSALDPRLPAQQLAALDAARQQLIDGRVAVFAAPLVDAAGRTRLHGAAKAAIGAPPVALGDAEIAQLDWLVQGVVGGVPKP